VILIQILDDALSIQRSEEAGALEVLAQVVLLQQVLPQVLVLLALLYFQQQVVQVLALHRVVGLELLAAHAVVGVQPETHGLAVDVDNAAHIPTQEG
jgi:hypothetical protein